MLKWLVGLFFFTQLVAQTGRVENELLWEISGNGMTTKSYLFGSIHSNDKRVFSLSDSTYFALNNAKTIALETDIFSLFSTWDTRKDEVKIGFDNKGKPYTNSKKASTTFYGNEDGMPQFLDAYFLEYCYNAQKKFFPLEKVEDQLNLLDNWNMPSGKGMNLNLTQDRMIELYEKGDIQALDRVMRANLSIYPGKYDEIIVQRNKNMVKSLDSLIHKGSVFCGVGAGHLAGENGLINLLRKKGFHLRVVRANYSEKPIQEKIAVRSKRNYTYTNDTIGLVATFPGKPAEVVTYDKHLQLIYREMGQGNTYSVEIIPNDGTSSLEEQAAIYIASPDETAYTHAFTDDGIEYFQGISDSYPEGLNWIRIFQNERYFVLVKVYGGNKFMSSNRPNGFFNTVWVK
ncbi:MAG: TraB/GumN family protein [Crocinitomicaceae bacterium]|nr:TraB/GumN family protein [Crocinitomicaceae bacterium]